MLGTGELPRRGPRMNGPALLALFPEIPLPRAFALADVSPAPLSDALRFILSSSAGAQRCSPIVRSPEPGLLGAPSRGTGAGKGRGSRSPPSPGAAQAGTVLSRGPPRGPGARRSNCRKRNDLRGPRLALGQARLPPASPSPRGPSHSLRSGRGAAGQVAGAGVARVGCGAAPLAQSPAPARERRAPTLGGSPGSFGRLAPA